MAAPGIAVLLAVQVSARAPLGLCAASMAAACVSSLPLHPRADDEEAAPKRPGARVLLSGWPIYLTAASAMSLSAVAELDLPPLLQSRHDAVGLSGVLLVVFGALSTLGSFLYGLRSWPGSTRRQSQVFLAATAAAIVAEALVPNLPGIAIGFLAAGCFQPVVMITRSLGLRSALPDNAQTAAYSLMYSVQGVGYSITAAVAAVMVDHFAVSTAILTGVVIAAALGLVSALGERALGMAGQDAEASSVAADGTAGASS
jgi:predicted MFS family arabinose efflux permease